MLNDFLVGQRAEGSSGSHQQAIAGRKNDLWAAAVAAYPRADFQPVCFAGTLTIALYIVTDMEYPRLGLIRIEGFDHFLAEAYEQMR